MVPTASEAKPLSLLQSRLAQIANPEGTALTSSISILNYEFYGDLEFERAYQLFIQSNKTKLKESNSKFWLMDIDGNDIILSKYEVYYDIDNNNNRQYYRMSDDLPLFQNLDSILNYKNKKN